MISQKAVSCPVVELPNIPFITELLCGDLLKERLWVFLYQALILGEKTMEFFTEIHLSFSTSQVDAIATSVNAHGVFAEVGPLSVFVSNHVCLFVVLCFIRHLARKVILKNEDTNSLTM